MLVVSVWFCRADIEMAGLTVNCQVFVKVDKILGHFCSVYSTR